jgi:hypothetical protein
MKLSSPEDDFSPPRVGFSRGGMSYSFFWGISISSRAIKELKACGVFANLNIPVSYCFC